MKIIETDVKIVFIRSSMRSDLQEIRYQLVDIAEKEAMYLFRLARKMKAHGCKAESIAECREEAYELHMTAYPERLIDDNVRWKYAFKI